MPLVSVIGYGRFGSALGALLEDRGYSVRAWDADRQAGIGPMRVASMQEAISDASLVFVAVPVRAMPDVFRQLEASLSPGVIVADVGSVKVSPMNAMRQVFGSSRPFVGTHPLFGPLSLARADVSLRVVICKETGHEHAARTVGDIYRTVGCEVIEQTPEEHDRAMADTHALAFFVAKGMIDAQVPIDSLVAPPSFQAMAKTIEAVRADAGHLFSTLHQDNPFAGESRTKLIGALTSIDRSLGARVTPKVHEVEGGRTDAAFLNAMTTHPSLYETRALIDDLDRELVGLLARRAELSRRASRAKRDQGQAIVDLEREQQLFSSRKAWAEERGLDGEHVLKVFSAIVNLSRHVQMHDPSDAQQAQRRGKQEP